MALPNLAADADLTARGITVTPLHTLMLAVASSLVRQAAGAPISETDSTVTLWGLEGSSWLDLPGGPVTVVDSVTLDGDILDASDYKLVYNRLWRAGTWGGSSDPLEVEVTMTHGLPVVPESIVNLVCDLAILGAATAEEGAHDPRVVAEQIDDYKVTFSEDAGAVSSAMEIPVLTRNWLRTQFGGGASVVSFR